VTALLLALILATEIGPLHAQDQGEIVLQLAVPGYMEDAMTEVIDQFEAEHPGIRVELVTSGGSGIMIRIGNGAGQGDIDDVLDEREKYATSADVLAVSSSDLSPEVTRAGYFLDLSPLINSDPDLDSSDFYTGVWKSFQWDNGFWALPVAADPILILYDRAAFDEAGLIYPDTWQTADDVENAIRTLTRLNPDGTVASPGLLNIDANINSLLVALLGQGLYDDTVVPSVPRYNVAGLEDLLTAWAQMQIDGLFNPPVSDSDTAPILNAPLQIGRSAFSFAPDDGDSPVMTPALLPGGRAGLDVSGFAVSSGTQNPEAAYALAEFLTNSPQAVGSFFGNTSARRSLADAQTNQGAEIIGGQQSPELAALIPTALENGIPVGETRFSEYLNQAVSIMVQDGVDASTALQEVEDTALARLDTASARRETTQIVVETPLPTSELPNGEIALKFGISSFISPLPNQAQWDDLAADFADQDPEVGRVDLKAGMENSLEDMASKYDCFLSNNIVPSADLGLLRSLDPLLASDPTFDPNDMLGGVMQQVQRDGQTWALPVMLQPLAMRYDPDLFTQAGAALPSSDWTVEDFEYALQALKTMSGDSAPFVPRDFGNTHLLMLIAAYGGLPLDYRTNPPTINYTDPATVDAIRRVLDLAKNGTMDYSQLASTGGGMSFSIRDDNQTPLYTESLMGLGGLGGGVVVMAQSSGGGGVSGGDTPKTPEETNPMVLFPQGSTYSAVSYDMSAAYISANSAHTEACYRFISALAQRPDLITGMPARRSLINNPDIAAAQGDDSVAFYQAMDTLMQQPNTVVIPSGMSFDASAIGNILVSFWLNRAFDRYVKEDADLDQELADAETFTLEFQSCTAAIAPFDPSVDEFQTYAQQYLTCATEVDPSMKDAFGM
jgi:ABC-type glycerol-3-phosphate transport system substrate-binding protein